MSLDSWVASILLEKPKSGLPKSLHEKDLFGPILNLVFWKVQYQIESKKLQKLFFDFSYLKKQN